ncbi:unnamed protein product [Phytomonas sp. Hart1]|nr:unnamed protein product [Phytomonas sp. Hart1]|eukprot:CCW65936.1 unnamed protein product [Phytomonas sp. isolate Hart1]
MSKFQESLPSFAPTPSSFGVSRFDNLHEVQHDNGDKDDSTAHSVTPLGDRLASCKNDADHLPSHTPQNLCSPFKDASTINHDTLCTDASYNISVQSLPPGVEIRMEDDIGLRGKIERLERKLLHSRTTIADYKDDQSNLQIRLQASETERRTVAHELEEVTQRLWACKRSMEEQRREHSKEKLNFIEIKSQRDGLLEKMQDAWDRIVALALEQKKSEAEKVLLQEAIWHEFGLSEHQAITLCQKLQRLNSRTLELTHEKQNTNDNYLLLIHCIGDAVRELNSTLKRLIHESFECIRSLDTFEVSSCNKEWKGGELFDQAAAELARLWEGSFVKILQSSTTETEDLTDTAASTKEVLHQLLMPLLQSLQGIGSVWRQFYYKQQTALVKLKDIHQSQDTLSNITPLRQQAYEQPLGKSVRDLEGEAVVDMDSAHGLRALACQLGCDVTWEAVQCCVKQLQRQCQDATASTKVADHEKYKAASITGDSGKGQPNENARRFDLLSEGANEGPKHTSSVQSLQPANSESILQLKPTPIPEMKPCYQTGSPAYLPQRGLRQKGVLTPPCTLHGMVSTPQQSQGKLASNAEMMIEELEKRVGVRDSLLLFFATACRGLIFDLAAVIQQREILYRYLQSLTGTRNTFAHYTSGVRLSSRHRRKSLRIWVLTVLAALRLRNAALNSRRTDGRSLKRRWWCDLFREALSSEDSVLHNRRIAGSIGGRSGAEVWSETISKLLDSEGNGEPISVMRGLLEVVKTVDALSSGGYPGHGLLPSPIWCLTAPSRSMNHAQSFGANHRRLFDHDEKTRSTTHDAGSGVTMSPPSLAGATVKYASRNEQTLVKVNDLCDLAPASGHLRPRNPSPARTPRTDVDISLLSSISSRPVCENGQASAISEPNRPNNSFLGLTVDVAYPSLVLKPPQAFSTSEQGQVMGGGPGLEERSVEDTLKLSIQKDYLERAHRGATPFSHFSLQQGDTTGGIPSADNCSSKIHISFPSDTFANEVMGMIEVLDRCVSGALKRGDTGVENVRERI